MKALPPVWYIRAKRNESHYSSELYREILDDGISEYNNAIKTNDNGSNEANIKKWGNLVLKLLADSTTNKYMIQQYEGTNNTKGLVAQYGN